jgi:hypothetical protein
VTRRGGLAIAIVSAAVLAGSIVAVFWGPRERAPGRSPELVRRDGIRDPAALARLQSIPFYRALLPSDVVLSGTQDRDGTLHVDIDLHAIAGPRLAAAGLGSMTGLLPAVASGTLVISRATEGAPAKVLEESWLFPAPSPILEILDRAPSAETATRAWDAVPGMPSAVALFRIAPAHLADPGFLGPSLSSWRDRVEMAENLLGRPLRAEFAEDLAGPAVFALYETGGGAEAEAIVAAELRRSDRISALLDTLFGLAALTERATVRRYRDVATASFVGDHGGPGCALAVDGPLLLIASSRARLESAIDARRDGGGRRPQAAAAGDAAVSWSAASSSAFAARGWRRLARLPDEPAGPPATMTAELRADGSADWRLTGHGPAPALTADPLVPFLRGVIGRRRRDGD